MEEEKQDQPGTQETPPGCNPKTSGLAIASFVLALIGIITCVGIIVTGPIAVVLGIIALVQINRNPQQLKGLGFAIAALAISGVGILTTPILAAILFPVFARAREKAQMTSCMANMKRLCSAQIMYSSDWDDRLPIAENWNDALLPYLKQMSGGKDPSKVFVCPKVKPEAPSYAMNAGLSGISQADINSPPDTVLLFDAEPGPNKAGGPELLPTEPRHMDGHVIGYADGHVNFTITGATSGLQWSLSPGEAPQPPPAFAVPPSGY